MPWHIPNWAPVKVQFFQSNSQTLNICSGLIFLTLTAGFSKLPIHENLADHDFISGYAGGTS